MRCLLSILITVLTLPLVADKTPLGIRVYEGHEGCFEVKGSSKTYKYKNDKKINDLLTKIRPLR